MVPPTSSVKHASRPFLSLVAVGDLLLTSSAKGFFSSRRTGYRSVLAILNSADITFGNLEVCLSKQGYPTEKLVNLRADPSLAGEVKNLGFDVVSLANNHTMDFGHPGLFETIDALDRRGIPHVGAGKDLKAAMSPVFFNRNNTRISFIGVSSCLALGAEAAGSRPGLAPIRVTTAYEVDPTTLQEQPGTPPVVRTFQREEDVKRLQATIQKARGHSDHVIVSIHWGVAYQDDLAEYQRPLAHSMIEAGADVVIGHHPHVPHGLETYRGGLIFYSLGNFIMKYQRMGKLVKYLHGIGIQMEHTNSNETFIVRIRLSAADRHGCEIIPISIDAQGLPQLAGSPAGKRIVQRLNRLSAGRAAIEWNGKCGLLRIRN